MNDVFNINLKTIKIPSIMIHNLLTTSIKLFDLSLLLRGLSNLWVQIHYKVRRCDEVVGGCSFREHKHIF